MVTVKAKRKILPKKQTQFVEKPITDPPPDTYPKSPLVNNCVHNNKVWVKGKAGHNCNDCGFFIPISAQKKDKTAEVVDHVAVEHKVEKVKMPGVEYGYRVIELPRAVFDISGEKLIKEAGQLGDVDKRKIVLFGKLLKEGYKIKTMSQTQSNAYLFLLEK